MARVIYKKGNGTVSGAVPIDNNTYSPGGPVNVAFNDSTTTPHSQGSTGALANIQTGQLSRSGATFLYRADTSGHICGVRRRKPSKTTESVIDDGFDHAAGVFVQRLRCASPSITALVVTGTRTWNAGRPVANCGALSPSLWPTRTRACPLGPCAWVRSGWAAVAAVDVNASEIAEFLRPPQLPTQLRRPPTSTIDANTMGPV